LIARHLVNAKEKFGYPLQTFCYFDKRLTPTIKESALLFADMNAGGLQLAVQSFNKDSLKAVKRRNMSDEDIEKAVIWAHDNGLKTSSELIFGLPFETKQSFLDALEFIMHMKVDTMAAHQLLLIKGVELNRKEERKRFNISTKYRPSFASAYDIFDGDFVCESEEVAVSSSHFNYEDYMDVRKVSLMFYIVNAMEYFKKVINYLVENDQNVLPLLDAIMNPPGANAVAGGYEKFVEDFVFDSNSELFDSHEEVAADLLVKFSNNSNRVAAPIRLNVYYASRLIYKEGWFSEVISQYLEDAGVDLRHSTILRELMTISENEWIDIKEPERGNEVMVSKETLEYLNIPVPQSDARQFRLRMSSTERQRKNIESYNEHYMIDDDSYYYNVLDVIQPRSYLRYASLEVEPVFEDVVATE
jgi:hypothetical protein